MCGNEESLSGAEAFDVVNPVDSMPVPPVTHWNEVWSTVHKKVKVAIVPFSKIRRVWNR